MNIWFLCSIGAICALLMVVGALVLLYKGAITLQQSSPDEAVKVEFKHLINIQTRYPAIGLFVIGICFLGASLFFGDKAQKEADDLQKQLSHPTIAIEIPVKSSAPGDALAAFSSDFGGNISIGNDDIFKQEVPKALDKVDIVIRETGYKEWRRTIHPGTDAIDGKVKMTANLEEVIQLKKIGAEVQPANGLPPLPTDLLPSATPGL
jgi:hypothetical protein